MGAMAVEIEQILPARAAVADIAQSFDIATAEEERPEQDAGERKTAALPGGHPRVEAGAPPGAQAFAQGVAECRACPQPPPCDDYQPGRRHDS
jgi:hypothetical protein